MTITALGNSGASNSTPRPAAQSPQGNAEKAPVVASQPSPASELPKPSQIQKAVESIKQIIEAKAPNSLAFSVDSSTGRTVVRITDAQTGETIRQIPSEEMLEIARSLDKLQGMLLQPKA